MSALPKAFHVSVTWLETNERGGVPLLYGRSFTRATFDDARLLRARLLETRGNAPEHAHDVIVTLVSGPGVAPPPRPSFEEFQRGLAKVRAALAECNGPLVKSLVKVTKAA